MRYLATAALLATAWTPLAAQTSPEETAAAALEAAPVWDGHNDVPIQLRARFGNVIEDFDFRDTLDTGTAERAAMHTDIARLRRGKVGAQWWSVYVSADLPEPLAVQMTIEQIDVTKRLIDRHPDALQLALTADDVEEAMEAGRVASLLGMEGGHSIGSSLAVLRQMYDLGARYMTLTHGKTLSWADSATDAPRHDGLNDFGMDVVREMNRIGMIVDLSHVSEAAMMDALDVAEAPVLFSHSGARAINGHLRNVPDTTALLLALIGENSLTFPLLTLRERGAHLLGLGRPDGDVTCRPLAAAIPGGKLAFVKCHQRSSVLEIVLPVRDGLVFDHAA